MKIKRFDYYDYNVFIVDDTYCNDIHALNKIKAFIDNNKTKN